jgi:hypothetical protein
VEIGLVIAVSSINTSQYLFPWNNC